VNDSFLMGAKSGWGSLTADGIKVTVDKLPVFFPSDLPRRPLMPRKTIETYPPFFMEDLLSGPDSGRIQLIKVQSELR